MSLTKEQLVVGTVFYSVNPNVMWVITDVNKDGTINCILIYHKNRDTLGNIFTDQEPDDMWKYAYNIYDLGDKIAERLKK